jgi:O-antigen/teichoic acid export membrane protein
MSQYESVSKPRTSVATRTAGASPLNKLSRNIFATASSTLIVTVSNLLLVPLFLRHWSPVRYGEWLTISSLAAYLIAADLGMTSAVINDLSQSYCKNDIKHFTRVLQTAFIGYISFACLGTFLGYALFRFLPFGWIGIGRESGEAGIAASLLVAQVAWSFPLSLVLSFYRTIGNFPKSQWLYNLYRVLLVMSSGCALVAGAQFEQIAAAQLGVSLAMIAITGTLIKVQHSSLAPGLRRISLKEIRALFGAGSPFALMTVGNTVAQQGPVLIISATLGPVFVTAFSTVRTLANSIRQLVGVLAAGAWPELTVAEASGNREVARMIHRVLVIASVSVSTAAGATLWFVGPQIIKAWTHTEIVSSTPLIRWFAVQLVLQAPWLASSVASKSANKNRRLSRLYTGSAVVGVIVAALTIKHCGLLAVPASIVVAEVCICSHFVVKDSCMLLGESYRTFAIGLWTRVLLLITVAFAAAALLSLIRTDGIIARASLVVLGTTLAVCTTSWFCWMNRGESKRLTEMMRDVAFRRIAWRPS